MKHTLILTIIFLLAGPAVAFAQVSSPAIEKVAGDPTGNASSGGKTAKGVNWTPGNYTAYVDNFWVGGDGITNDNQADCWQPSQASISSGTLLLTGVYSSGAYSCFSIASESTRTLDYASETLYRPKAFTFGTFEVKMQMAGAQSNSSFWLLNTNCWPDPLINFESIPLCGGHTFNTPGYEEMDVVEYGYDGGSVAQNVYGNGYNHNIFTSLPTAATAPHVYLLYWTGAGLTYEIDGNVTSTQSTTQFTGPVYMWLDADIGTGQSPQPGSYPTSAIIYYVKHWNGTSGIKSGTLDCSYVPGGPSAC